MENKLGKLDIWSGFVVAFSLLFEYQSHFGGMCSGLLIMILEIDKVMGLCYHVECWVQCHWWDIDTFLVILVLEKLNWTPGELNVKNGVNHVIRIWGQCTIFSWSIHYIIFPTEFSQRSFKNHLPESRKIIFKWSLKFLKNCFK